MRDIKNYTLEELKQILIKEGFPHYSASQIFNWVYKKRIEDFSSMTDLSKKLRAYLNENFSFPQITIIKKETASCGVSKILYQLKDNSLIETAVIPDEERYTLCLSTQVGCKFRCNFCVSGTTGFRRNLSVSEIINQYLITEKILKIKITNIVYMGIGEPLDNFENVVKSIKIFTHPSGIYLGKRRICISTVGIPEKIKKLADLKLGVKLSLSLHSADEEKRKKLIPLAKRYSLKKIMEAVKYFSKKEKFPITFEYLLIKDFNMTEKDAYKLASLLKGIKEYKINLIPYNPSQFFLWQIPLKEEIENFKNALKKYNLFFTLRKPRGRNIEAACGQLKANF